MKYLPPYPFSLCVGQLVDKVAQGHPDSLGVHVHGWHLHLPDWGHCTQGPRGAATALGGACAGDGAATTLCGGRKRVVKAYNREKTRVINYHLHFSNTNLINGKTM